MHQDPAAPAVPPLILLDSPLLTSCLTWSPHMSWKHSGPIA